MKPGKILLIFLITVLISACPVFADNLSNIPAAFVDIGYGTRPTGMGGAFVGLADDHNAVMWNPAGMLNVSGNGVSFMWAKQMGFVPYNYLSYSRDLGENHRIGGAAIYSGDDVLSETTALVSYAASLYRLGKIFSGVSLGLNAKLRWASFGNNEDGDPDRITGDAFGYGFDLGAMVRLTDRMSMGLLYRDILNDIAWNSSNSVGYSNEYSESVPNELTIGVSYKPTSAAVVVMDLRKSLHHDVEDRLIIGAEQQVFNLLKLRAGWGQNIGAEYRNEDLAFGIGVFRQIGRLDFMFDFAYLINDLKNTPRVGAAIDW